MVIKQRLKLRYKCVSAQEKGDMRQRPFQAKGIFQMGLGLAAAILTMTHEGIQCRLSEQLRLEALFFYVVAVIGNKL